MTFGPGFRQRTGNRIQMIRYPETRSECVYRRLRPRLAMLAWQQLLRGTMSGERAQPGAVREHGCETQLFVAELSDAECRASQPPLSNSTTQVFGPAARRNAEHNSIAGPAALPGKLLAPA